MLRTITKSWSTLVACLLCIGLTVAYMGYTADAKSQRGTSCQPGKALGVEMGVNGLTSGDFKLVKLNKPSQVRAASEVKGAVVRLKAQVTAAGRAKGVKLCYGTWRIRKTGPDGFGHDGPARKFAPAKSRLAASTEVDTQQGNLLWRVYAYYSK